MTEAELLAAGEWAKQLILSVGGQPETAFKVAAVWVEGIRAIEDKKAASQDWEL